MLRNGYEAGHSVLIKIEEQGTEEGICGGGAKDLRR